VLGFTPTLGQCRVATPIVPIFLALHAFTLNISPLTHPIALEPKLIQLQYSAFSLSIHLCPKYFAARLPYSPLTKITFFLLSFPQTSPFIPFFSQLLPSPFSQLLRSSPLPRLMSNSSSFYVFSQTSQLIFHFFQTIPSPYNYAPPIPFPLIMPHFFTCAQLP
jgi:hypothetical protein